MKTTMTLSLSAALAALIAAPMAFAQDVTAPAQMDGQMGTSIFLCFPPFRAGLAA
ncbi:MAG: hypothetical protein ACU0B5_03490 [Roseovarius sp.]